MERLRLPELLAFVLTAVGLALLTRALAEATPPVFFGTEEDLAVGDAVRTLAVRAGLVLAAAGALLWVRRRRWHGAAVLAPGLVCTTLVAAWPEAVYAWVAFLFLAPAGFVAALAASLPDVESAPG